MTLEPMPVSLSIKATQPQEGLKTAIEKRDPELMRACREFESLLANQMLKEMRNSIPKTDLFGSREKEEMFQDMLDQEITKNLSSNNSLGLADVIYTQLTSGKNR